MFVFLVLHGARQVLRGADDIFESCLVFSASKAPWKTISFGVAPAQAIRRQAGGGGWPNR